jgi:hypothetical protein
MHRVPRFAQSAVDGSQIVVVVADDDERHTDGVAHSAWNPGEC